MNKYSRNKDKILYGLRVRFFSLNTWHQHMYRWNKGVQVDGEQRRTAPNMIRPRVELVPCKPRFHPNQMAISKFWRKKLIRFMYSAPIHLQLTWNIPLSDLLILCVLPYLTVWPKLSSRNNASSIAYLRNIKKISLSILFSVLRD
jgi:hypothetical protein